MSKKSKFILILIIIIFVVLTLAYLFFYHNKQITPWAPEQQGAAENGSPKVPSASAPEQPTQQPEKPAPIVDTETLEKNKIVQLASFFIERLGSYSNQSDYKSLASLEPQATDKMKAWIDNFIKQQKAKQKIGEAYWGITTKVISSKLENADLTEGTAQVVISTQRHETADETAKVYYQKASLQLLKEDGIWKTDEVKWENK